MGFSNEDNCCQLQGIGKLIKEMLLKGIIKVDELTNVAGNADFVKFIANICFQMTNFFHKSSAFWSYFFLKSCLKVLGAAYTRVWLIHESLRSVIVFHMSLLQQCLVQKIKLFVYPT